MKRLLFVLGMALLAACSGNAEQAQQAKGRPPTPVTVATAQTDRVQVVEHSVGTIDSANNPAVAAEVHGRIVRIHVEEGSEVTAGQLLAELDTVDLEIGLDAARADVKRLEALLDNQNSTVKRYRRLYAEKTISFDTLEDAESQLIALREELVSAKTRRAAAEHRLSKARVVSPIAGRIEARHVSVGDFIDIGMPLFRISDNTRLRVRLPFPETASVRLRSGLTVELSTPTAPGETVTASITAIRPMVGSGNRALNAVVELENPGGWRPGASVNGRVILEERDGVLVPQISVVRRPAGLVVYRVQDGAAVQTPVQLGVVFAGQMEILSGLKAGESVVVDGAGFLTDGTRLSIQDSQI